MALERDLIVMKGPSECREDFHRFIWKDDSRLYSVAGNTSAYQGIIGTNLHIEEGQLCDCGKFKAHWVSYCGYDDWDELIQKMSETDDNEAKQKIMMSGHIKKECKEHPIESHCLERVLA